MKELRIQFRVITLLLIALFLFLVIYGGYAVTTYGNRWFASSKNPRIRQERKNVTPGDILDRSGMVLATTSDGERIYQSNEASRRAAVHVLGDNQGNISNGVETFQAGFLLGFERSLAEQVLQVFREGQKKGDNVTLTVDAGLSAAAAAAFNSFDNTRGKRGAAVVMNYQTGEVLAQISLPSFDPHHITEQTKQDLSQPFWNRALQSAYTPGSTFKVVTALAALRFMPESTARNFHCDGALTVQGRFITDAGNARHGELDLKKAFSLSCNNTFAQIALAIGDERLRQTAEAFGFNDNLLFRDLVVENSRYPTTNRNALEVAWSGPGQSGLGATPLHMCMIAASVANNGIMMEPALIQSAVSDNGVVRYRFSPRIYRTPMTPDEAATLKDWMRETVKSGTGTRAQVQGVSVYGKTGSAESALDGQPVTHGWFIGFINDASFPYAVSVIVESVNEGDGGGSTAAPVAQKILSYIVKQFKD